jgi:hypothetical protein
MSYDVKKIAALDRKLSTAKSQLSLALDKQNMENRLNEEEGKNRLKLELHRGPDFPLLHGQKIQLQHQKSGLFLSLDSQSVAQNDPECMKITLQEGSEASYFRVAGLYKIQIEGSPVFDRDQVKLLNCTLGDHYLHCSFDNDPNNPDDTGRCEVNLSSQVSMPWTLELNRSFTKSEEEYILLGQPVTIFHSEAESYMMASLNNGVHLNEDVKSLKINFVFETPNEQGLQGGMVCWATPYRMRHVASGQYLAMSSSSADNNVSLSTGNSQSAPFCLVNSPGLLEPGRTQFYIHPAQAGTGVSGFIDWATVRNSGCRIACSNGSSSGSGSDGSTTGLSYYWLHRPAATVRTPAQKANPDFHGSVNLCTERAAEDAVRIFAVEGSDIVEINYVLSCVGAAERYLHEVLFQRQQQRSSSLTEPDSEHELQEVGLFVDMLADLGGKLDDASRVRRIQDTARDLKLIDALMWAMQVPFLLLTGPGNDGGDGDKSGGDGEDLPPSLDHLKRLHKIQGRVVVTVTRLIDRNFKSQLYVANQNYKTCWVFHSSVIGAGAGAGAGKATVTGEAVARLRGAYGSWVQALMLQLKWRVGVGTLLSCMIHDNITVLQSSIDRSIIAKFIEYLKQTGPFAQWLDFFSDACVCDGRRVPQQQETILRLFLSVRTFSGEFDGGGATMTNRAELCIETIQDHTPKHRTPYAPRTDVAEVRAALDWGRPIDGLKFVAVPKEHAGKYTKGSAAVSSHEADGVVFFAAPKIIRGVKTTASNAAQQQCQWLRPFRADLESGIAHLDRGLAYLGRHMYLEGLPRTLVGFSPRSTGSIFPIDGDLTTDLYRCPAAEVTGDMQGVVTTLGGNGTGAGTGTAGGGGVAAAAAAAAAVARPRSTAEVRAYYGTTPMSADAMVWCQAEHLLWVLEPNRLHPLVFGNGEAWAPASRRMLADPTLKERFERQVSLARYYEAQVNLMAALCFDGNARCISVIARMFPYELVFVAMSNPRLPSSVRRAFVDVMVNVHVTVHPHAVVQAPRTIRLLSDLKRDYVLGSGGALPQTSPENMRRLRLLKFFTSDFFKGLESNGSSSSSSSSNEATPGSASSGGNGGNGQSAQTLRLAVTRLCRAMVEHGFYGTAQGIKEYLCNPVLGALDGRRDKAGSEGGNGNGSGNNNSNDDGDGDGDGGNGNGVVAFDALDDLLPMGATTGSTISPEERYADNASTAVTTKSKIESCKILLSVASIRLDYRASKLLHGWQYLQRVGDTVVSTVRTVSERVQASKQTVSRAID